MNPDKIAQNLAVKFAEVTDNEPINVIIQMEGGLLPEDEKIILEAGGRIKSKLYIIDAYAATLKVGELKNLTEHNRIKKIYFDGEVRAI